MVEAKSLIRGKLVAGTREQINYSPTDGNELSRSDFITQNDLENVFNDVNRTYGQEKTDCSELIKLAEYFVSHYQEFVDQIMADAGFIEEDAKDLVDGSIEFCRSYSDHLKEVVASQKQTTFSFKEGIKQKIYYTSSPYGVIAATTPRNTPLITELTIIVHALWSGNSLMMRPSPGVAGTVAMLIEGLLVSFSSETLDRLCVIFADAKEFVEYSLKYTNLIHYVGSSKYLETTLIAGIKEGVKVLVDGDGCSVAIVERNYDVEAAAKDLYKSLIRCNGEICITIRAILVEKSVYDAFKNIYLDLVKATNVGLPKKDNTATMGPLFSGAQAENINSLAQKYPVLYKDDSVHSLGENYTSPVVVDLGDNPTPFLHEALFGPMVGLAYFEGNSWKNFLAENPINLTDTVFSNDENFVNEFLRVSKSPRKVINVDPTVESVFEPWGAFLPSGWNDVSYWYNKYRNNFQIVKE